MKNTVEKLAGVIMYSEQPQRLAEFYIKLGIPLETATHGKFKEHQEGLFKNVHFAIWKKSDKMNEKNIIPSFLVNDLEQFVRELRENGVNVLHDVIDLGEGKKVVSFHDADQNVLRAIQIV
ncbi:VOC family protein [Leptospira stimsonii]|uniref:Glyoxalase n=1 Tax=Leptospira stimsonii TaxID=2202203 RepID=A0ABY2N5G1_9LEPT|nr:hypothetical protein [Leptospira stimsonii]TGK17590.1 hypothetical protein EHO98_14025 [Leptospira stimsonii]TGM17329.1 hypothetical protein EHQ90_07335 [Leptospira stimsonii]